MFQNNLWVPHKILIVQSTEKRLLCLKIQLIQTTQTTLAITARTQAQIILTHLAATKALINQAMLITVAEVLTAAQMKPVKVLTALTLLARADKF